MASFPDCEPVFITRKAVQRWRDSHGVPRAKLGIYFGFRTSLYFLDGLEPAAFEFFPLDGIGEGCVLLERAAIARREYESLLPDPSGIF